MHSKQQGLTLPELMIVLALMALLATQAIPAWHSFVENNRSTALKHSLQRAFQQARSMAINEKIRVELCASTDGIKCNNNWSGGWVIRKIPGRLQDPHIEQITHLPPGNITLHWAGFQPRIVFQSNGYSTANNGRFFACRDARVDWQMVLNRQGRLRQASAKENRELDQRCAG